MSLGRKALGGLEVDGVHTRIVVTDPTAVSDAVDVVRAVLEHQAAVTSPARTDSELAQLNRTFGRTSAVSTTLLDHLRQALFAAELTSGTVDPTSRGTDWHALELSADEARLPDWMRLDLSATSTGIAVDCAARTVADVIGCGVLVSSADHVAVAGEEPAAGWQVSIDGSAPIAVPSGSGVVTSAGALGATLRSVTVAAPSAFLAATLSRAAVQLGSDARSWLAELGMPARIVYGRGTVVTEAGWPAAAA